MNLFQFCILIKMKFIDQKKGISSIATIQSYNSIIKLPDMDEPQLLDFQQDHNKIFAFMNQMKAHKKKFKELTESQRQFLEKVIKSLQSFLNQKKWAKPELVYEGLVQVAIITSIYQGKVQMIHFSQECVKKIVNFIEELDEQEEASEQNMDLQGPTHLTYQHKLGAILHMIIILICKTQKQKDIHYVKLLKKLFKPAVRQKFITIQIPKDQKVVKMYSVVLGYIGEKYNTQKLQKKITDKIIKLFVLVTHDKTLFYLANYLRQRCTQNKVNSQYLVKIGFIEKIKGMIKQHKDKPHISHLLDLYTRLMAYSPTYSQHFYDQEIMFCLTESKEDLQKKYPALLLTANYNRIVSKLLSQFVKSSRIQQNKEVKSWCTQKIIYHFDKLQQNNDIEFSLKTISLLFYLVSQQTILSLLERNLIERIFDLATTSSDKITLIIMHIAHKLFQNEVNLSPWMSKVLMSTVLYNISKIDRSTVHYIIVQEVKKLQELAGGKIYQDQELIVK